MDKVLKWSELFPNGRNLFYEGRTPAKFAKQMRRKYNFDPSKNNNQWNKRDGYQFHCPNQYLDEVYGTRCYPLGS